MSAYTKGVLHPFCLLHIEFVKNANFACKRQGVLVIQVGLATGNLHFWVHGSGRAPFFIFSLMYKKYAVHTFVPAT